MAKTKDCRSTRGDSTRAPGSLSWEHIDPISGEEARTLGLAVSEDLPEEVYQRWSCTRKQPTSGRQYRTSHCPLAVNGSGRSVATNPDQRASSAEGVRHSRFRGMQSRAVFVAECPRRRSQGRGVCLLRASNVSVAMKVIPPVGSRKSIGAGATCRTGCCEHRVRLRLEVSLSSSTTMTGVLQRCPQVRTDVSRGAPNHQTCASVRRSSP